MDLAVSIAKIHNCKIANGLVMATATKDSALKDTQSGSVRVEIFDQAYNLRGSDPEYILKLAEYVDAKMRAVAEATDVRFAPLSGSRLVISRAYGCGKKKGVYRWRVAAGRLTLTKLQDTCAYSVGLYAGVWKRAKM